MKSTKIFLYVFFFVGNLVSSQIQGVVIDNVTKKPIPFVSIWAEKGNQGTTSEENGEFHLNVSENNANLLFSALGYEKKTISISKEMIVELTPSTIELNEVVVTKKYGTRSLEIGETGSSLLQAYENGPRIDIKFFPYQAKYKKTKFIKQVVLNTDCRIDEATLKLHFYEADLFGSPGKELLDKDFIVTVNKGVKKTIFNLSSFNLRIPKTGIFVGFERLKIEKNRYEKSIHDSTAQSNIVQTSFCPFVLYNEVERDSYFSFSGGKWIKESIINENGLSKKATVYEPAINMILTN